MSTNGTRAAAAAAAVAALALLAGCTGGRSEPPASTDPPPGPALADGQEHHPVGTTFQSGPFLVTVGELVYDRPAETLYIGARMRNLSDDEWEQAAPRAVLRVGGLDQTVFFDRIPRVPPGYSTELTGQVGTAGGDPLADGTLVWGAADQWQTELQLADGAVLAGGLVPVDLPLDAWGQIGRHTVHVYAGRLFTDAVHASRPDPGQRALRLYFDEYASQTSPVNGFFPADHLQLTWPDGTTVEALRGGQGRGPQSWTVHTGHWVDLPVPADPAGEYQLLLASVSRHAFGLYHPELVERVPIGFRIDSADSADDADEPAEPAGPVGPGVPEPLPWPVLPQPEGTAADPVDLAVAAGEVNAPGFGYTPTRVQWDPATSTATVTGTARLLPPVEPPDPEDLFFTPSQFRAQAALVSAGRIFDGLVVGADLVVEPDQPREIAFEFRFADALDPADLTLFLSPDSMPASVVPLTAGSPYPLDPAPPELLPVGAPPAIAGDYTVQLVGYRFGLPGELDRPPAGKRALEVSYDVTLAADAQQQTTGLGFRSRAQLFIAHSHGYLQQAEQHSGDLPGLEPGQTARTSATYYVPSTWQPRRMGFAVRSLDENADVGGDRWWVETTFGADLLPAGAGPDPGGF